MVEEILKKDPYSKGKKTTVAVFVSIVGLLAIIVFLIFGKLLADFQVFEANRTQAANELTSLDLRIKNKAEQIEKGNTQLQRLNDTIAEREAQIGSQQTLVNDYNVMSKKTVSIKKEYQTALDELKTVRENTAEGKGTVSALNMGVDALTTQKSSLQNEIVELDKTKKAAEQSIVQLSDEINALNQSKSTARSEVSAAKKASTEISANLVSAKKEYQTALDELKTVRENTAEENGAISGYKMEIDELTTQKSSLQNELAELDKKKKAAEQNIVQLSDEINELEKEKATAQTGVLVAKKALAEASTNLTSHTIKVESAQKALLLLEEETSKVKVVYDTLSAQLILAQETIKTKKLEKEEMEAVASRLAQRKAELSGTIKGFEERKLEMEAQVISLDMNIEQAKARLQAVNKEIEAAKADK